MTFQQLQYLMEVWRTGSISGAAKNLFCAQSSISAAISNLEEELGFPIFIRSKKGVIPTVQGSAVIEHATRIFESYQAMLETDPSNIKRIRIGAPSIELLDDAFVGLVAHYAENNRVSFLVDTFSTMTTVRKLKSFELDVAILVNHRGRFLSVENTLKSKGLEWQMLGTLPAVCQIGPDHPLYNKENVKISDLQNFLFVDDIHDPLLYNEYLKGIILLSPEKTVSVCSAHARNLLVAKGLGYSISAGAPKAVAQALRLRSIPLKDVEYAITVITNPQQEKGREVETYIQLIKRALEHSPSCV